MLDTSSVARQKLWEKGWGNGRHESSSIGRK